jgi:hypothetical protein
LSSVFSLPFTVPLNKAAGKWQARIRVNGRVQHLGLFVDIEDAHAAYCAAAKLAYGEFANGG